MFRNSIMPLPQYDPSVDYKVEHIAWLNMPAQRNFTSDFHSTYGATYLQMVKETYLPEHYATNRYAYQQLVRDMKIKLNSKSVLDSMYVSLSKDVKQTINRFFVTIGFNHQTWSINKCLELIQVILSFDWLITARIVFELHRENGEHPHIHMLIETTQPKSKVVEKLWAAKGIKKIVLKKTFIDVKVALVSHDDYIAGIKQESKMKYVEMDRQWRLENDIEPYYEK